MRLSICSYSYGLLAMFCVIAVRGDDASSGRSPQNDFGTRNNLQDVKVDKEEEEDMSQFPDLPAIQTGNKKSSRSSSPSSPPSPSNPPPSPAPAHPLSASAATPEPVILTRPSSPSLTSNLPPPTLAATPAPAPVTSLPGLATTSGPAPSIALAISSDPSRSCASASSGVCQDEFGRADLECCQLDGHGRCAQGFTYSRGVACQNGVSSCCTQTQGAASVISAAPPAPAPNKLDKAIGVGIGIAAAAATLAAGAGVTIAHFVQDANVPKTLLKTTAQIGDSALDVVDASKFKIGDAISIGEVTVRTISGFGSIIVDRPLTRRVDAGAIIAQLPKDVADKMVASSRSNSLALKKTGVGIEPTAVPETYADPSFGTSSGGFIGGVIVVCLSCALLSFCVGCCVCIMRRRSRRTGMFPGENEFADGMIYDPPMANPWDGYRYERVDGCGGIA